MKGGRRVVLRACNLSGLDLSGYNFSDAELPACDFSEANLTSAKFVRANLFGAHFNGADLSNTSFERADLRGAKFDGAKLYYTHFKGADLRRGEVLGFLGPNGAGKSTTMKMVCGYLTPTSGTARVQGHDVVTEPMAVKAAIGYLPEGAPTYGDMRVSSFLRFIAQIRGFNGAEIGRRVDRVREMATLDEVFDRPVETLSKGFKRRVGLAQAILHDPEVLIMDEPTDGLDPNQKHQVRSLIKDMAHNKAIVISTHILEEVEAICTRAVVIAHGKLLADGTPEQLLCRDARHNAVVVKLAADQAADIVAGLAALDQVAGVDALGDPVNGTAAFRARPKA
ncbi:MAG TPA: hypothetical protein DC046_02700, partial [Rhodospirillaceae bacterium]|nr:hypothetical protein [Rhodospirillaceae bacterium]